jgi:tRNA_anti-like
MKSNVIWRLSLCALIGLSPFTSRAGDVVNYKPIGKAIPAESLCLMYAANSLSMETYEKKRHEVHGSVLSVGRTGDGLPYVLLYCGEGSQFSVKCIFPNEDAPKLSNLMTTMHVIVEGELQGITGDVVFTGCKLLRTL